MEKSFSASFAGTKTAISFYMKSPAKPEESKRKPTVLYANVKSQSGCMSSCRIQLPALAVAVDSMTMLS
jgi:hypothetical protein